MKSLFHRLHLFFGLLSGIVVFTVAITGCIYAFEEEIRGVIHEDLLEVTAATDARKPLSELIDSARAAVKGPVKNIRISSDSFASVQVNFKNHTTVFVDPYTGKVLGSLDQDTEFLGIVLKIHRNLYLGDPGKYVTGISALIFFFMLISGIVLWWPGKRNRKGKFRLSLKAHPRKATYDLHSVLGFYAAWILLFSVLTGLIWSFKWVEGGMYWLTNSVKDERKPHSTFTEGAVHFPVDKALAGATAAYPGSEEVIVSMPEDSVGAYRIILRYESTGFTESNALFYDQYTGEVLKKQLFENNSLGEKLRATNYDIHTGKILGLPGQLLIFFAGLIAASLPVTGFMMWRAKRKDSKIQNSKIRRTSV